MVNEKVSVIVPVYNAEPYLERCINSILNQTYSQLEIILVDDGSTDRSSLICDNYQKLDSRIQVKHISNRGVSTARNLALNMSSGAYITFIDADDVVHPRYIELLLKAMVEMGQDIVCSNSFLLQEKPIPFEWNCNFKSMRIVDAYKEYDYGTDYVLRHVHGNLYKASLINHERFEQDIYVGEDALFNAKLIVKCRKFTKVDTNIYGHIVYEHSLSHGKFNKKRATLITAWHMIMNTYQNVSNSLVTGGAISLADECKLAIKKILKDDKGNKYYTVLIREIRCMLGTILGSNLPIIQKLIYVIICVSPKIYFRLSEWYGRRGKR